MSEHDETLRKTLEEVKRLRSEKEETLRTASSAEFAGQVRTAERIYWVYAIVCVAIGVPAINFFARSYDLKTLISSAVIILVVYETTVLLKLWFAVARMKMSVLKDVKLLRMEVAQLASAVGAEGTSEPSVKYEPMRGTSRLERKIWLCICVAVAILVSSWATHQFGLGGGDPVIDDTMVVLAADGSATSVTEIEKPYSSFHRPTDYPFFAPKDRELRFVDPAGNKMPVEVTPEGTHNRYQVTLTDAVFCDDGMMRHTRISEAPGVAMLKEGIWTYESDIVYGGRENQFSITVCLPAGAKIVSANPDPTVQFEKDGRTSLRFQGTRGKNKKFAYSVRYELGSEEE